MLTFVLGFFMSLGKAAVYKHIPVYYSGHVGATGGAVRMIGGLGGFVLPLAFGALNVITGIWQSSFVLLFVIAAAALGWMHYAIRRAERAEWADREQKTDLPELASPQLFSLPGQSVGLKAKTKPFFGVMTAGLKGSPPGGFSGKT